MDIEKIKQFYDCVADEYAEKFINELSYKPFDRHLLLRFAADNKNRGTLADLGCGPGQTTRFLSDAAVHDIVGIDLSPTMIKKATQLNPHIPFETGNILQLDKPDQCFGSILAFYTIVHFKPDQLKQFFHESFRLLRKGGQLLISFHIGDEILSVDEFLGKKATADFYFHNPDEIAGTMTETGYHVIDTMIRYPYKDKEYPSKRAYIIAEK